MIYIYKFEKLPEPPTAKGSFNKAYNESYDVVDGKFVPVAVGSFNLSFGISFDGIRKAVLSQDIFIPKTGKGASASCLVLHNVAENIDYDIIRAEDIGIYRDYYKVRLSDVSFLPSGEYLYQLQDAEGNVLSEGIAIVVGKPMVWKEEKEKIEYNEYGN